MVSHAFLTSGFQGGCTYQQKKTQMKTGISFPYWYYQAIEQKSEQQL